MRPGIGIIAGAMRAATRACSSATMPRAAMARLIERPRSRRLAAGRHGARSAARRDHGGQQQSHERADRTGADQRVVGQGLHASGRRRLPSGAAVRQCFDQLAGGAQHVFETVVERYRRQAHEVRLAPVAQHAASTQRLENAAAELRAGLARAATAGSRAALARSG